MVSIESDTGSRVKSFLIIALIILLGLVVYKIREIVFLFAFACILSSALYPVVSWLKTKRFPPHASILIFFLLFLAFVAGFGFLLFDMIGDEVGNFIDNFPHYVESVERLISHIPYIHPEGILKSVSENAKSEASEGLHFAFHSLHHVATFLESVLSLLTIGVFTFFLLTDAPYFESLLLKLLPDREQDRACRVMNTIAKKIGMYVRGQFVVMCIVGILTWIGLSIAGVPYAPVLGLLSFLLDIVPIVGPLIGEGLGLLVALGQDPITAVYAAIVYFIVQHTESYFLSPTILGRTLGLHPFWILASVLLSSTLFGIKGLLIAVPITVTAGIVLDEFYIRGFLKHSDPGPLPAVS